MTSKDNRIAIAMESTPDTANSNSQAPANTDDIAEMEIENRRVVGFGTISRRESASGYDQPPRNIQRKCWQ